MNDANPYSNQSTVFGLLTNCQAGSDATRQGQPALRQVKHWRDALYIHTHKCLHISTRETKKHLKSNPKNEFGFLLPPNCVQPGQGRPLSFHVLCKMEAASVDGEIQSRREDQIRHG